MTITKSELDLFREAWKSTRVTQYSDYLTYKTGRGWGKRDAESANELIRLNGWNLVAIPSPLFSDNSFLVQFGDREV